MTQQVLVERESSEGSRQKPRLSWSLHSSRKTQQRGLTHSTYSEVKGKGRKIKWSQVYEEKQF